MWLSRAMVYEKMWLFAPIEPGAFLPDVSPMDPPTVGRSLWGGMLETCHPNGVTPTFLARNYLCPAKGLGVGGSSAVVKEC